MHTLFTKQDKEDKQWSNEKKNLQERSQKGQTLTQNILVLKCKTIKKIMGLLQYAITVLYQIILRSAYVVATGPYEKLFILITCSCQKHEDSVLKCTKVQLNDHGQCLHLLSQNVCFCRQWAGAVQSCGHLVERDRNSLITSASCVFSLPYSSVIGKVAQVRLQHWLFNSKWPPEPAPFRIQTLVLTVPFIFHSLNKCTDQYDLLLVYTKCNVYTKLY